MCFLVLADTSLELSRGRLGRETANNMADQICVSCHDTLWIEIEADSEDENSKAPAKAEAIPDDVEFACGCHFHW